MKFIELFGGVGGFRVGLERANSQFDCVWTNQFEPSTPNVQSAADVYRYHFGNKTLSNIANEINIIINQTDFDCVNVSGFKKLNGNQILSEDISYILNDVKSKLIKSEKHKTVIHLFNTKYLLDNKTIKNLPIGLYGEFYSHQLTFFSFQDLILLLVF